MVIYDSRVDVSEKFPIIQLYGRNLYKIGYWLSKGLTLLKMT